MTKITILELYDIFIDTLERGSSTVRNLPDEELLCYLFEDFDVQARSFFHGISLDQLREAELIDDDEIEESKEIRKRWLALESQEWTPDEIRCNSEWNELFRLCDSLRLKVISRNSGMK